MVFTPDGDQRNCRVIREDASEVIQFAPAEADKASEILGIALGMESLPVLQGHITNSPFVVRFLETGFCRLEREDGDGSISFLWEEGDQLIITLKLAVGMSINERTLSGPAGSANGIQQFSDGF